MESRSDQLQIRVTRREKATLKRLARAAGQDVSAYVLARSLPDATGRVASVIAGLRDDSKRRFALAELNDHLTSVAATEFRASVEAVDVRGLSPVMQNYVAAMVEHAASAKGVVPPAWVRNIASLEEPYFATSLAALRLYLLQVTPVAYKRRNIFTEAGLGARV